MLDFHVPVGVFQLGDGRGEVLEIARGGILRVTVAVGMEIFRMVGCERRNVEVIGTATGSAAMGRGVLRYFVGFGSNVGRTGAGQAHGREEDREESSETHGGIEGDGL